MIGIPNDDNWQVDNNIDMSLSNYLKTASFNASHPPLSNKILYTRQENSEIKVGFSDILSLFRQGLVKCMTLSQL